MSEIFNLQTLCRCCHADGNFKSLQLPYVYKNNVEIYSNMLEAAFDIRMQLFDTGSSICDLCIQQLRNAYCFKLQVFECEEKFREYYKNEQASVKEEIYESDDITAHVNSYNCEDSNDVKYENEEIKDGNNYNDTNNIEIHNKEVKLEYVPEEKKVFNESDVIKIEISSKSQVLSTEVSATVKKKKRKKHVWKQDPEFEIRIRSDNGTTYICKICGQTCDTPAKLRHHIAETHKEIYKCSYCSKLCENRKCYDAHINTHIETICKVCGKRFSNKNLLAKHMLSHMRTDKFQCDICQKFFAYKQTLRKHLLWHRGEHRKCVCDICGRFFTDKTNMNAHIRTVHLKMRPFECTLCDKSFTAKKHLKAHVNTKHTDKKPYYCDVCGKSYANSSILKTHNLRKHQEHLDFDSLKSLKPTVTCRMCHVTFESRSKLQVHMRCHIGQKEYKCHLCAKDFVTKYSLRRHIEAHSGVNKIHCDICNASFGQQGALNRHKFRHHNPNRVIQEKVKCDLCNKYYRDMEKHIDSHNKRPFSCEFCSKCYPERNTLTRHIKVAHLHIKPFACTLCDKTYTKICGLRKHCIKIHKVEPKSEKVE